MLKQGTVIALDRLRLDGDTFTTIRLFQNDHDPDPDDVDGSYVQADFSGYSPTLLGDWNAAFVNGTGKGEIDADTVSWVHSGGATGNTCYGVYVTNADGHVVYAERFPAPQVMASSGDTIVYNAKFTLVTQ